MAFVLAPLRALDIAGALDTAGALDRTGGLPRAALVAMLLQEPAHQLLAPPVQFPFEVAHAHLPGFAGGEEGFGLREDGLGRARRRAGESDAGDDGSHLLRVERASREPRRRHGHCQTCLPSQLPQTPYQNAAGMSRGARRRR